MQGRTAEIRAYCHQRKSLWGRLQAHNLKGVGLNTASATNDIRDQVITGYIFWRMCPNSPLTTPSSYAQTINRKDCLGIYLGLGFTALDKQVTCLVNSVSLEDVPLSGRSS